MRVSDGSARRITVSSSDSTTKGSRGLPIVAWLLLPLLGIFFLVYPILVLFASNPTPARISLALGGAALFVCVFLWLMWTHEPLQLVPAEPSEVLKYRATIAFLAVLAGALSFVLGPEWRMLFFFHINVAAGIMLPKRDAYVTIAGIAVITFVLGYSLGFAWLAVPAVALGLWATSFVGQVAAVAELRAAREELARLAVSEERLRFARDLHDLLGHSLSLITLKSELAGRLLPATPDKAAVEVNDIESVTRRALHEVREAVAGYRKPTLENELDGARELLEAADIACRIENGVGPSSNETDAVLAWVVREGATNVIRHSRARSCGILLKRDNEKVYAEITDDGRGPPPGYGEAASGSGLSGLSERVAALGGEFEAHSLPGSGFRLRVSLPLRETAAAAVEPVSRPEILDSRR